jgi:phospholipase/carboxylesterase
VRFAIALAAAALLAACATETTPAASLGRLAARPRTHVSAAPQPGETRLGIGGARDGVVYVPRQTRAKFPVMVLLHGATGAGERIERRLQELAEAFGFIIVAPDSRGRTWDVIGDKLGPDVDFIDRALAGVFARYPVDAAHVAVAGFSDGASYALTIGVMNGDLFTHIIAFSPGFLAATYRQGLPPIFVSHGTEDEILPVERTATVLVPALRRNGYRVEYREFDGPHTIPPEVARQAMEWWLGAPLRGAAEPRAKTAISFAPMPHRYPQQVALRDGRKVLLRPFTAADTDALYDFFQRLPPDYRRFAWDPIENRALIEAWGQNIDYDKVLPLLAFDGARIVADATLHRRPRGPLRLVGRVKWMIDPAFRGVGLGTTLVSDFITIARERGLRHLNCMLISDLEADAVKTLEGLGFQSYVMPQYGTDPDGNQHDMTKLILHL